MAFNPFVTFQRNRRFWMATILMICMVSFVFCTGMKGDMAERIQWIFGSRGTAAFQIDGNTYTTQQLHELRTQRNLANKLMMNCAEMAFRKLSKELYDMGKQEVGGKAEDLKNRQQRLALIQEIQKTLAQRKARPRYFDIGIKFDDLVEFAMWQAVADRLGIYLDEEHVRILYFTEFFYQFGTLEIPEFDMAERETLREFRDVSHAFVRKAITEEFRVRIAQQAYLGAQPSAFVRREGFSPRFAMPEFPDQIRAPMTFAQLWDDFKKQRTEYNVSLLPINIENFVKGFKEEPTEDDKAKYYLANKDKPADPSSDVRGLQIPQRVKVEYVIADPTSAGYMQSAKLVDQLSGTTPFVPEVVVSPLAAVGRFWALNALHEREMQDQYDAVGPPRVNFDFRAAPIGAECTTPMLFWFAKRHPESIASMVASMLPGTADSYGSMAGLLAWGAVKHGDELDRALAWESKRRAPHYAALVGFGAADLWAPAANYLSLEFHDLDARTRGYPRFPLEVVRPELEDMRARRSAEEKAQQNIRIIQNALEKADGDAEKYKRELGRLVPELQLTHGPAGEMKNTFINRYTADESKELAPLRDAYLRYMDAINMFEARDMTPARVLKASDFYKILFDSSEAFSATALYRAMPWPPVITKPNNQRVLGVLDPRAFDARKVGPEITEQFRQHMAQNDPLRPAAAFDGLFKRADKPLLFWRTAKRDPINLPADYAGIAVELKRIAANRTAIEQNLKKIEELAPKVDALRKQEIELRKAKADAKAIEKVRAEWTPLYKKLKDIEREAGGSAVVLQRRHADLKEDEADLKEVQRAVVEGWKFERARSTEAVAAAKSVADNLLKSGVTKIVVEADRLKTSVIPLKGLSRMYPELRPDGSLDYSNTPLPKDKISFPREDMVTQALDLFDLSAPIKIGNKELDELNKDLFDRVKKQENARGNFVQILTNKPRSVYYVAVADVAPPDKDQFVRAIKFAGMAQERPEEMLRGQREGILRDLFVERLQQQHARTYRENLVTALKESLGYAIENEKAKSDFDDRAVGD